MRMLSPTSYGWVMKMKMTPSKHSLMELPNMNANARIKEERVSHISRTFCSKIARTMKMRTMYNAVNIIRSNVAKTDREPPNVNCMFFLLS